MGEIILNSYENKVVEATVGIAYHEEPQKAIEAIEELLTQHADVCKTPPPQIGIEAFADSSINIGYRYWVPTKKYFQTMYQINLSVHQALTDAGITIPFPQRDVHMVQ
jgi:small conductance mechanosensitive channel